METRTWTENGTPVSKEKTVAFSGHRTNRIAKFTADREKLFREVAFDTFAAIESYCIKKGYDTFLSGMCEGFDLIAAEEVLNLKKRYPHIRLKCVVPFKGQAERYTQADKRRYDTILAQADEVVTLQDGYTEGCFLRRNDYLLENSAFLMVYYDTVAIGGTFYTLKRAVEQKRSSRTCAITAGSPVRADFPPATFFRELERGKKDSKETDFPNGTVCQKSKRTTINNQLKNNRL